MKENNHSLRIAIVFCDRLLVVWGHGWFDVFQ